MAQIGGQDPKNTVVASWLHNSSLHMYVHPQCVLSPYSIVSPYYISLYISRGTGGTLDKECQHCCPALPMKSIVPIRVVGSFKGKPPFQRIRYSQKRCPNDSAKG